MTNIKDTIKSVIELDYNLLKGGMMSEDAFLNRVADYIIALVKNEEAVKSIREEK